MTRKTKQKLKHLKALFKRWLGHLVHDFKGVISRVASKLELLALVYLIIRVEGLHAKFDALYVKLTEFYATMVMNFIMYSESVLSAALSIWRLFRGDDA